MTKEQAKRILANYFGAEETEDMIYSGAPDDTGALRHEVALNQAIVNHLIETKEYERIMEEMLKAHDYRDEQAYEDAITAVGLGDYL